MKIFGPPLSNGTPQFDRHFERKLIIGLVAFAGIIVGATIAFAESDRGGTNGCGSCGSGSTGGTANRVNLDEWRARNEAMLNANNTWRPANNWFDTLLQHLAPAPSIPVLNYTDSFAPRGGIINGSTESFHLNYDGRLAKGV
jgi:hypothetical protein